MAKHRRSILGAVAGMMVPLLGNRGVAADSPSPSTTCTRVEITVPDYRLEAVGMLVEDAWTFSPRLAWLQHKCTELLYEAKSPLTRSEVYQQINWEDLKYHEYDVENDVSKETMTCKALNNLSNSSVVRGELGHDEMEYQWNIEHTEWT
jgi:hypothetical protein